MHLNVSSLWVTWRTICSILFHFLWFWDTTGHNSIRYRYYSSFSWSSRPSRLGWPDTQRTGCPVFLFLSVNLATWHQSPSHLLRPPPCTDLHLRPVLPIFLLLTLYLFQPSDSAGTPAPWALACLLASMAPTVGTCLQPGVAKLPSHSLGLVFARYFLCLPCLCWGWQEDFTLVL